MYTVKKGSLYVRDMRKGGNSSYTSKIEDAVKYDTYEEAKKNSCGNETVVQLSLVWGERE
jgi:hypothetical protein